MRKTAAFAILTILLAILAGAAVYVSKWSSSQQPNSLFISGNIEITEVDASFQISGRVIERLVDEGYPVEKGDIIAYLDNELFMQEVALSQAEVSAAQAELLEMEDGYLPEEIGQAEAKLQQAQADLKKIELDHQRQLSLFQSKAISAREFDVSQAAYTVAKAQVFEAKEKLALLLRGTRIERINKARANLQRAEQSLAVAKTRLGYTTLVSPLSGYVLSKNIEAGEYATAGTPIVTVGNLNDVWLRGYIDEPDLGKIKLGQKVQITTDTFPDKQYHGILTFISSEAEFTPKNIQTAKERVKLVFRVKITIDNPEFELKPGMPADAIIAL